MKRENRDWRRRKGAVLLLTTLALVFLIPLVGLAIDASLSFVVKARLSSACDAAALAAARNLSVGLTIDEQAASAQARALAFFDANFPEGYMSARNRSRSAEVAESGVRTRTVTVSGQVDAPVYFMGMFGYSYMTIKAEGKASRRDVNLILVLDRSGSMQTSGSCAPMKAAAQTFISMFANQRDRLGLVVFSTGSLLAFPPAMNFRTASPSMPSIVGNIVCEGWTTMAQALSEAYNEIVTINEPGALNVIVLFTDGNPTALTASYPVKRVVDTRFGYGDDGYSRTYQEYAMDPSTCKDSSGRTYTNPLWDPADKLGNIACSSTLQTGTTSGVFVRTLSSVSDGSSTDLISDRSGCRFGSNSSYMRRDVAYIPNVDYYGNATTGSYFTNLATFTSGTYAGQLRPDKPNTVTQACTNATDSAAIRIRGNTVLDPVIYTIGLGDVDPVLLRRIANDPDSPIFDDTKMQGMYAYAEDNTQLSAAFYRIASEVLRIAR
jgi:Flp pilus assembly protein TadG